jgi:stage II sporulation protein AA (anti-sigma F factor antagonist)
MMAEPIVEARQIVVALQGELDLTTADSLRDALDTLLDRYPGRDLVVDMSRVDFLDSSGLGVLLGRYRRLEAAGRKLRLVGVRPAVKAVLRIAGVTRLAVVEDVPERPTARPRR